MQFVGAGLAAATWPLGALPALALDAAAQSVGAKTAREARGSPHATLGDHVTMQLGALPRLLLAAYLVRYSLGDWRTYATQLVWSWILPIVLRDVALCLFVGSVGDFFLLSNLSPFRASMHRHKYSDAYAQRFSSNGTAPIARDVILSTYSASIAGLLESLALHLFATGVFRSGAEGDQWWRHGPTLFLMASWFYSQNVQFYLLHRCLHRWGTTSIPIPDVGAWLYTHVHSLHHGAKNPTCFSGIAMHPLEAALYQSYAFFPCLFGAHPIAMIYIFLNLIAAAMLGHSGFEFPAQGSQPHWLHHQRVHVNYAENHVPLDWLFGTFAADESEAHASIMRRMRDKSGKAA